MPVNFVAIDFETASSVRDSACALGAVIVCNGKITDRRYTLLNPHVTFDVFSTYIHGITQETVQNAPDFSEIYSTVYKMLSGNIVAAHNAGFDVSVLNASCISRNLPIPNIHSFDSVEIARKAWPNLEKYKLNILAQHFQFPLKHHNAVEDATACAMIILKACEEYQADSLPLLQKILAEKALRERKKLYAKQREQAQLIKQAKLDLDHLSS